MIYAIPTPPLPHAFILQSNLSGPPSESFQIFTDSPFWIISYDWFPLLFSQKSSDPP